MKVVLSPVCNTHYMLTQLGIVNCLPKIERGTRKGEKQPTKK